MDTNTVPTMPALTGESIRFLHATRAVLDDAAACIVLDTTLPGLDRYRGYGDEIYVARSGAKLYYQPDDTWLLCGYAPNGSDLIASFGEMGWRLGYWLPPGSEVTVDTVRIHGARRWQRGVVAREGHVFDRGALVVTDTDGRGWACNQHRLAGIREVAAA